MHTKEYYIRDVRIAKHNCSFEKKGTKHTIIEGKYSSTEIFPYNSIEECIYYIENGFPTRFHAQRRIKNLEEFNENHGVRYFSHEYSIIEVHKEINKTNNSFNISKVIYRQ